ncbi:MAG: TMEM165/GDT1 family protein [Acetobacteraceae bacterium]|nr:TMEM165/GDT1 family protein [Acetobacteraceae bacterium]
MALSWTELGPTVLAAFAASLVECVEALTVVLAVGATRGWRPALGGAGMALALLLLLVAALGPALTLIPLRAVQLVVGAALLLFGLRWLRKAVGRAAGRIPLHDETATYARETAALAGMRPGTGGMDRVAVATAFKITMVEGIEVVFIVIAMGAGGSALLRAAIAGAVIALLAVVALGFALRRPVSRIPENALKFGVGVLLCGFGTFWVGEGAGLGWPGGDLSLLALVLGFGGAALLCVGALRKRDRPAVQRMN